MDNESVALQAERARMEHAATLYDKLPQYEKLDRNTIEEWYFTRGHTPEGGVWDPAKTFAIRVSLHPDNLRLTDASIKIQRVRSLMFAKVSS